MPTKRSQEFVDLKHGSDKKASKPLIEKRRRARINQSLAQLKTLVIDPNTTESSRQAKLEKADILEMTVRHLREIRRSQSTEAEINSRPPKRKFEMGYTECVRQVELFLTSLTDLRSAQNETDLKKRLKDHLCRSLQGLRNPESQSENSQNETLISLSPSIKATVRDTLLDINEVQNSPNEYAEVYFPEETSVGSGIDLTSNSANKRRKFNDCVVGDINYNPTRAVGSCQSSKNRIESYDPPFRKVSTPVDSFRAIYSPLADSGNFLNIPESPRSNLSPYKSDPDLSSSYPSYSNASLNSPVFDDLKANSHFNQQTAMQLTLKKPLNCYSDVGEMNELQKTSSILNIDRQDDRYRQIPLIPRRLQNGEWALVLPGSLAVSESEGPLSAFRLVLPSDVDSDQHGMRQQCVSSPLSSSVSDMSSEEYCFKSDGEASVKLEFEGHSDTVQCVWRPW